MEAARKGIRGDGGREEVRLERNIKLKPTTMRSKRGKYQRSQRCKATMRRKGKGVAW